MAKGVLRLPSTEFRSGKYRSFGTPYFVLKEKENEKGKNRIGVVISTTVHKNAVQRNFWRRQAKALLASRPGTGKDILIIFSSKVNSLTKKQFKKILTEIADRF